MVGYIVVNKDELKVKDFETYRAYYCGLCRQLKKNYGISGQLSLTYDMTFLAILLTGLYEPETTDTRRKCTAHPLTRHRERINEFTDYAADMNLLLSYYKCEDDWKDEHRIDRAAYAKILERKVSRLSADQQKKAETIEALLKELSDCEHRQVQDIDLLAGLYGQILAEVFSCREDIWACSLRKIGSSLGKFVYLMDAYEDIEQDIKKGTFNPLKEAYQKPGFDENCQEILTMFISSCCREFEKLPIIEHAEILRNILYSGIWSRFDVIRAKRQKENGKEKQE
ncbi:MAG: DUF5685 family protein [Eubacteriales bacterium]|nr:DUF5685 family protein [Eubacteriales bacterium]